MKPGRILLLALAIAFISFLPAHCANVKQQSELLKSMIKLHTLGKKLENEGSETECESVYETALSLFGKSMPETSVHMGVPLDGLVGYYHQRGRCQKECALVERFLAEMSDKVGRGHIYIAAIHEYAAKLHLRHGQTIDAARHCESAIKILQISHEGHNCIELRPHLLMLASICTTRGDYNRAESLYQQILSLDRAMYGPMHPDYAETLREYSKYLTSTGKLTEAAYYVHQAEQIELKFH